MRLASFIRGLWRDGCEWIHSQFGSPADSRVFHSYFRLTEWLHRAPIEQNVVRSAWQVLRLAILCGSRSKTTALLPLIEEKRRVVRLRHEHDGGVHPLYARMVGGGERTVAYIGPFARRHRSAAVRRRGLGEASPASLSLPMPKFG